MRFIKPLYRFGITFGIMLLTVASLGVVPWALVPASASAQEKAEPKPGSVDQKDKGGWGRFVSFQDGTLTLESNAGVRLVWNNIGQSTKTQKFDAEAGKYVQVEKTAAALDQTKAGTFVMVGDGRRDIRIGARAGRVSGTFVSFKDGRLLILGKDLGESYVKKYGSNLHFNRFRDDVPVHESIDGGEYKLIGTANKVLPDVKEGTILTVHAEGDDNITLIQVGVPKKK